MHLRQPITLATVTSSHDHSGSSSNLTCSYSWTSWGAGSPRRRRPLSIDATDETPDKRRRQL